MMYVPEAASRPFSSSCVQSLTLTDRFATHSLLLFASGVPTAEKPTARRFYLMSHGLNATHPDAWKNYKEYLNSVSLLIPLPPALYRRMPAWIKQTILLDWPMYRFDEDSEGKSAIEESRDASA